MKIFFCDGAKNMQNRDPGSPSVCWPCPPGSLRPVCLWAQVNPHCQALLSGRCLGRPPGLARFSLSLEQIPFPPACPQAIDERIKAAVFASWAPLLSAIGLVESVGFFGAQRLEVLFWDMHRISMFKAVKSMIGNYVFFLSQRRKCHKRGAMWLIKENKVFINWSIYLPSCFDLEGLEQAVLLFPLWFLLSNFYLGNHLSFFMLCQPVWGVKYFCFVLTASLWGRDSSWKCQHREGCITLIWGNGSSNWWSDLLKVT